MAADVHVSEVRIRLRSGGPGAILGWASCVWDRRLLLDSIEIRRGAEDRLFLVWPGKETKAGKRRPYFHPINRETREAIEEAILQRLSARGTRVNEEAE